MNKLASYLLSDKINEIGSEIKLNMKKKMHENDRITGFLSINSLAV